MDALCPSDCLDRQGLRRVLETVAKKWKQLRGSLRAHNVEDSFDDGETVGRCHFAAFLPNYRGLSLAPRPHQPDPLCEIAPG